MFRPAAVFLLLLATLNCTACSNREETNDLGLLGALLLAGGLVASDCSISSAQLEQCSGGGLTVFDDSVNAFDIPAQTVTDTRRLIQFLDGNSVFDRTWVEAPAAAFDGRGPVFNNSSCRNCHVRDGRGRPPLPSEGSNFQTMLFRASVTGSDPTTGGPLKVPNYGTQLQLRAVTGVTAEATATVSYTENPGSFPDGEAYSLRTPTYNFTYGYGTPAGILISPRTAPAVIGMGLIGAVPESVLREYEDPSDANGDGISGRANMVYDPTDATTKIGRYGWKANRPSLNVQNQGAFLGDIGITNFVFSSENCEQSGAGSCAGQPSGNTGQPFEVAREFSLAVNTYTALLGVVGRRDWTRADVIAGKQVFNRIGCESCHRAVMATGANAGDATGHPELNNQTIRPYSDFLLHDMGAALADNRPDFQASGQEWRTAPLWGVGMYETVNGHNNLLHDGRARGFKEAILWHGGEAQTARDAFYNLPRAEREQLVAFLRSL